MVKSDKKVENSIAYRVLREPWITEAATRAAELNKYVFKVGLDANKKEIKKAIESLYEVAVTSVNTVNVHRKARTRGRTRGWKAGFKKAVITLKAGDSIQLFEGK